MVSSIIGETGEFKVDRQHIGYTDNPKPFTNHTIHLKKGDLVFLYTDGYMEQFGVVKTRKYTKKILNKSILSRKHLPMTEI